MRPLGAIVALALVLVALGASLSFSGYNESLQIMTSTETRSYTATLTRTIVLTSTESFVTKTTSANDLRNWIYLSRILPAAGQKYCYYDFRVLNLTKGQVHVTVAGAVFWVLSPGDYERWVGRGTCEDAALFEGGLKVPANGLVEVPASGPYYFVFLSPSQLSSPPLILLTVNSIWEGQVTVTIGRTSYLMQQTAFPTRTVTLSTQPAGFGLIFYMGTGLIVVAGVALAIGGMKAKRSPAHSQPKIPIAPPALGYSHDRGCRCDFHRLPRYERVIEVGEERTGKNAGDGGE